MRSASAQSCTISGLHPAGGESFKKLSKPEIFDMERDLNWGRTTPNHACFNWFSSEALKHNMLIAASELELKMCHLPDQKFFT